MREFDKALETLLKPQSSESVTQEEPQTGKSNRSVKQKEIVEDPILNSTDSNESTNIEQEEEPSPRAQRLAARKNNAELNHDIHPVETVRSKRKRTATPKYDEYIKLTRVDKQLEMCPKKRRRVSVDYRPGNDLTRFMILFKES